MNTQKTHMEKIFNLLSDGYEHSTEEIKQAVYGRKHKGIQRISARIFDLKNSPFYHAKIYKARRDKKIPSLFWYRMKIKKMTILNKIKK